MAKETDLKELGKCFICSEEFSVRSISRHVKSCINNIKGKEKALMIHIKGGGPFYIIVLGPLEGLKFKDLDIFLRDVWYECCGHMSRFDIGNEYSLMDIEEMDDDDEKIMKMPLRNIKNYVNVGYEYDFGSTSYAQIKLLDIVSINQKIKDFKVISYNNLPKIKCEKCEKYSEYLAIDYNNDEHLLLCKKHIKEIEDNDDDEDFAIFKLENNPRVGVCGDTPETDKDIKKYLWKKVD
jgi:hypothetical protein